MKSLTKQHPTQDKYKISTPKIGRPSTYSTEIAEKICERIASGESLARITLDEDMPGQRTVYAWLANRPDFQQQYARAREAQMDAMAQEITEIADDARNDYMERITADGEVERVLDAENIQRSKLRIDTRKWIMSKLAPKKYGDKLDLNFPDSSNDLANLSDAELIAKTKALMAKLGIDGEIRLLPLIEGDAVEVDIGDGLPGEFEDEQ